MLVLADHSVFVNGMMGFSEGRRSPEGYKFDNGNWAFANRTIDWLKGGGPEPRTRCLFIEDGHIIDKFADRAAAASQAADPEHPAGRARQHAPQPA